MKIFTIVPILFTAVEGFSMITPRFADFPRRFGKYLKEFDEIFEPDWPSTFMEKQLKEFSDDMQSSSIVFHRASPRYEVMEKPDTFELSIDVSGYKADEIEVGLKGGGRILTISGQHEQKDKRRKMSSQFQQNFSLDPSIQTDQMCADLKGTTLVVTAPRIDMLPESRKIPIVQNKLEASPEEHQEGEQSEEVLVKPLENTQEKTLKP